MQKETAPLLFSTPEEEIQYLRSKVLSQEKAHEEKKESYSRDQVIKEHVVAHAKLTPSEHLKEPLTITEHGAIVLNLTPKGTDAKIEELLGLLETRGLLNTLTVVQHLGDALLEDDFHRVLIQYIKKNLPVRGVNEKSTLFHALHMTLFEVALPFTGEEEKKSLKEILSSMEQFYAGVLPRGVEHKDEWLSFEIAVGNDKREVVFYCAVPDRIRDLFEKQTLSIFPHAKIVESPNDYNIFTDKGFAEGSRATYKENAVYSLKQYQEFDYDPLTVLLNAFSKIAESGEGAAVQFLVAPPSIDYIARYKKALLDIDKGVPVKKAIDIEENILLEVGKGFGGVLKELVSGKSKVKETGEKEAQVKEALKRKMEAPIASVSIRIITSAESRERAIQLREDIEAAFNQFEVPTGNTLQFKDYSTRELGNALKDFTFRLFNRKESLPLSLRELTGVFHFPTESASSVSELRQHLTATAPAPNEMGKMGILLGVNRHRTTLQDIYFAPEDRLRHFYCLGQTGTGKSTLLKRMIIDDIRNGEGVCMIDPHGSDIEDVLASIPHERLHDVIYFDPAYTARPMGLNMLEYDERFPEQKTFVVNELLSIFNKLFDMKVSGGPAFEQYFRNSALLVMEHPASGSTLLEIGRVLSDKAFRELKLSHCKNPIITQFWRNAEKTTGEQSMANFVPYITNKFDSFLSNDIMRPVVSQQKSSFNFRDIMDNKKILLVNLSKGRLGDINANLIGLILVGKILMAALSRVDSFGKTLPPFYFYIDEFQNITTDSIATILSEARKYKLSLTIAHQFIAQLDERIRDAVFGNVGSLATFRVGADDAEYLEKTFGPTFTHKDIMNLDNYHAYMRLLVGNRPAKPFNVATPGLPKLSYDGVGALKELSYLTYGVERATVEADVLTRYQ